MGTWSDNDRNAAADRELHRDLDRYLDGETGEEEMGVEVERVYVVSIDVCVKAASTEEAKKLVQNSLINNYLGLTVFAINITDAFSEDY